MGAKFVCNKMSGENGNKWRFKMSAVCGFCKSVDIVVEFRDSTIFLECKSCGSVAAIST